MEETIMQNVNLYILDLTLCALGLPFILDGLDLQ